MPDFEDYLNTSTLSIPYIPPGVTRYADSPMHVSQESSPVVALSAAIIPDTNQKYMHEERNIRFGKIKQDLISYFHPACTR